MDELSEIEAAEFALSLGGIDAAGVASPARIYDYLLNGSHNFAADRMAGEQLLHALPTLRAGIRANRAFLHRSVAHLAADLGITQFLDLGSGIPTVGNVHEIARSINPACRVVYVDLDPVAIAHARYLLKGDDRTVAVLGDMRDPGKILAHPLLRDTLDLDQPVAVLMNAVLHFVPDSADPAGLIAAYVGAVGPVSYLALSHSDADPRQSDHPSSTTAEDYENSTRTPFVPRTPDQVAALLTGLDILAPGIVPVQQWRIGDEPDAGPESSPADFFPIYGVLARKPAA